MFSAFKMLYGAKIAWHRVIFPVPTAELVVLSMLEQVEEEPELP